MDLAAFVRDFAAALKVADALKPQARSARSTRVYQPGLGPHSEDAAVGLTLAQLNLVAPGRYFWSRQVPYPRGGDRCDLGLGSPLEWAIEVKMARPFGDNGKPDDTYLKDLLSPYPKDRSALTDAAKLRTSSFLCRKAVLLYGFDHDERALQPALETLDLVLRQHGRVTQPVEAAFADLVHPVHRRGRVVAWEVL